MSVWLLLNAKKKTPYFIFIMENKLHFDDVRLVLDQKRSIDFVSTSSKPHSVIRYVAPPGHIILIPSQPVFPLSP